MRNIFFTVIFFVLPNTLNAAPLSGRLAFVRDDGLIIYDLASRRETHLLSGPGFRLPKWSPKGQSIAVKGKGGLLIVDSAGSENGFIGGIPHTAITHWIDEASLLIMIERPYRKPDAGFVRESDIKRDSQPAWYYGIYRVGAQPSALEWRILYGGGASRDETVRTADAAIERVKKESPEDQIVCALESGECFLKTIHPYLLPQSTTKGTGLILAARPESGTNIFLDYAPRAVQKVSALDSTHPAWMLYPGPMWVDPNSGYYPVWSPSGSHVLYSATENLVGEAIFILPSEATKREEARLVVKRTSRKKGLKGGYLETFRHPRWSPDGRHFACSHTKPKSINPFSDEIDRFVFVGDIENGAGEDVVQGRDPDWTN